MSMASFNLKFHEYADIFPLMTDEEFELLKKDIQKFGLLVPIILYEGKILDGRNRYKACKEIRIEPEFKEYTGNDPISYVISENLFRRHLTSYSRIVAIIKAIGEELKEKAKEHKRMSGGDRKSEDYKSVYLVPNKPISSIDTAQIIADTAHIGRNMVIQTQHIIDSEYFTEDIEEKLIKGETLVQSVYLNILREEKGGIKTPFLDWIKYYDIWNFANKLKGFGENREAQCPPQVILNFIYYFTKENDLIVDPMAGGGATTDCANYLKRRSLCYDKDPSPLKQVKFNDIRKGYPEEAKGCDAIFIDPPYGAQKGEVFKEGSVSSLSTSDYVEKFMKKLFIDSYNILNKGGMIGFIIQNQCHINLEGKYYWDFGFEAFRLMKGAGFTPYRRIGVPLVGPVQYEEHDMERCKEEKKLLGVLRDLVVMIK